MSLANFFPYPLTLALAFLAARALWFFWLESRYRLYPLTERSFLPGDVFTTLLLLLLTVPLGEKLLMAIGAYRWLPPLWSEWPLAVRFALYVVLADFGHYWMHRFIHHPLLWRAHRWHHAPEHTGWLSGNRESIIDRIIVSLPYAVFAPLLFNAPGIVWTVLMVFAALRNDWMHLNTRWGWRWLEYVIVTPRYHHIHHSKSVEHHHRNFGIFFSCWDRLFGTYYDPEATVGRISFGINEKPASLRLYLGI